MKVIGSITTSTDIKKLSVEEYPETKSFKLLITEYGLDMSIETTSIVLLPEELVELLEIFDSSTI